MYRHCVSRFGTGSLLSDAVPDAWTSNAVVCRLSVLSVESVRFPLDNSVLEKDSQEYAEQRTNTATIKFRNPVSTAPQA
jgi:hypothetical protein